VLPSLYPHQMRHRSHPEARQLISDFNVSLATSWTLDSRMLHLM
jgi:hypothetical protein